MSSATATAVKPRMAHPVEVIPDALNGLLAVSRAAKQGGLPETTVYLVHLRASQINGCSHCVEMHARELRRVGESDERIFTVAAWRETPYFTDAERAALELTEAATRLSDQADPVPDWIWEDAERHFDEQELAALVIEIATINTWNRLNVTTRQPAGRV